MAALAAVALAGTTLLLLTSLAVRDETSAGDVAAEFAAALAAILLVAGVVALVVRTVPARWRPLVLCATVLPALTAAGAVGLPESAIHFSDDAEWAYRAGREISLAALVLGTGLAALVARVHGYRVMAIAGVAALTFGMATVARDLVVRDSQPSWCYAENVDVGPGGVVATSGEDDGCTVLLPRKDL